MAIPDYEAVMLPLLRFVSDGSERSLEEAAEHLSVEFKLSSEEREKRIPSGGSTYIKHRTGWARTYLKKAGLLSYPKRGYVTITDRGREVLQSNPKSIDQNFLKQFPEFVEFLSRSNSNDAASEARASDADSRTPEEMLEASHGQLRAQLADELLEHLKACSPSFFERLVIDLLVAMGYGGSTSDAAQATRASNDEGIDGIIKEDKLGLDTIYVQAKRWENPVHRPEIQKFAGALQGKRARKGIFITTSTFSDGAKEFAKSIESHIVFIDGQYLAQLMIDHGVGVTTQQVFEIKKIDLDYFVEG